MRAVCACERERETKATVAALGVMVLQFYVYIINDDDLAICYSEMTIMVFISYLFIIQ